MMQPYQWPQSQKEEAPAALLTVSALLDYSDFQLNIVYNELVKLNANTSLQGYKLAITGSRLNRFLLRSNIQVSFTGLPVMIFQGSGEIDSAPSFINLLGFLESSIVIPLGREGFSVMSGQQTALSLRWTPFGAMLDRCILDGVTTVNRIPVNLHADLLMPTTDNCADCLFFDGYTANDTAGMRLADLMSAALTKEDANITLVGPYAQVLVSELIGLQLRLHIARQRVQLSASVTNDMLYPAPGQEHGGALDLMVTRNTQLSVLLNQISNLLRSQTVFISPVLSVGLPEVISALDGLFSNLTFRRAEGRNLSINIPAGVRSIPVADMLDSICGLLNSTFGLNTTDGNTTTIEMQGVSVNAADLLQRILEVVRSSRTTSQLAPDFFGRWDLVAQMVPLNSNWSLAQLPIVRDVPGFPNLTMQNAVFVLASSANPFTFANSSFFGKHSGLRYDNNY
jgi:hypothetical protein